MEIKKAIKILVSIALFIVIFFVYLFVELKKSEKDGDALPIITRERKGEEPSQPVATTTELIKEEERAVTVEEWEVGRIERIEKAEEMIENSQISSSEWELEKAERLKKLEELRNLKK